MARKVSVVAEAAAARAQGAELASQLAAKTRSGDSFQNFGLNLGMGTDNALADSTYGFNPITRNRTLVEWIHRGSWLGGVAVDLVADDMTRAGVEFGSDLKPNEGDRLHSAAVQLAIWDTINDGIRWARLYGGCIVVMLINGQKFNTPLRLETVGPDQFRGLYALDRWMIEPSLNDLVTELGPSLGMPRYYTVSSDAPALRGLKIHYSRILRLEGTRLPWNQRAAENLWGLSVYERLYDKMVAFDSATQGAAQLVYKSSIRTYKLMGMRELVGGDSEAQMILSKYVDMMRRFQGIEGITLIDGNDDFVVNQSSSFPGIADALVQFGQQLSGALQIPLVRLFGQSPAGLNSTGDADLITYYDGIAHQQERSLRTAVEHIYQAIAQSEGIDLPPEFSVRFKPLWQMNNEQKAAIGTQNTTAVIQAHDSGVIGRATALKELKQQSSITGLWSNISDEEIAEAEEEPPPSPEGMERDKDGNLVQAGSIGPDGKPLPLGPDGRVLPPAPPPGAEGEDDGEDAPKDRAAEEGASQDGEAADAAKGSAGGTKENIHLHVHDAPKKFGSQTEIFEESEHPRGPKGKWVHSGTTSGPNVKIKKATTRAFEGQPKETRSTLNKLETGQIGESVVLEHLRKHGFKEAGALNTKNNNFPIDLVAGNTLFEVKSGLVSNGKSAQQWRATIGQPGPTETAWLKTAGAEEKAAFNAAKKQACLDRKWEAKREYEKLTGMKAQAKTVTTIIDPDTNTVDVYMFDGFHSRIAWGSPEAKAAYVGSYKYEVHQ